MTYLLRDFQQWLVPDAGKLASLGGGLALAIQVSLGGGMAPAQAADRIILTYGALQEPFSVADMKTFAKTGELSSLRQFQLRVGGADPEVLREFLNQKVEVNFLTLDRSLNSLPGEFLLFQIGKVIHNRQRVAPIQSLRAATVLSAKDDNAVTMLEFLENYPLPEVFVDGRKIVRITQKIGSTKARVVEWLASTRVLVEQVLNRSICSCEPTTGATDSVEPVTR